MSQYQCLSCLGESSEITKVDWCRTCFNKYEKQFEFLEKDNNKLEAERDALAAENAWLIEQLDNAGVSVSNNIKSYCSRLAQWEKEGVRLLEQCIGPAVILINAKCVFEEWLSRKPKDETEGSR